MTNITREHLELAAKAAGYAVHWGPTSGAAIRTTDGIAALWRPNIESLDTWRLAADCDLVVNNRRHLIEFFLPDGVSKYINFGRTTGRTAAEAVTLAAAEIGRAMG